MTETQHKPRISIIRNHAFVLLWCAFGISAAGDHISEMAIFKSQDALNAPNMTQLMAKMTFVFMVPFFLFGPLFGLMADRLPRRGLMIAADVIRAVIMFGFTALLAWGAQWGGTWGVFAPLALVGTLAAMFSPARSALLPRLVTPVQLIQANALLSGLGVIATMLAAIVGGWLAQNFAPHVSFRVDAVTFIASAIFVSLIRVPRHDGLAKERERRKAAGTLRDGLRFLVTHRRIAEVIVIAMLVWAVGAVARSVIPTIVRDCYARHSYFSIGIFQAYLAMGMITGALVLTGLGRALRSNIMIVWGLFGVGGALVVVASSTLFRAHPNVGYTIGAIGVFLAGMFATGLMASCHTLIQRMTADWMRGRVFGVYDLATVGGLLLSTGTIGIFDTPGLDRRVGWLLAAMAFAVVAVGITVVLVSNRRTGIPFKLRFWYCLNEFYCRWWFRLERDGPPRLPHRGAAIVVANHTSSIDPLLLLAACPYRHFGFLIASEFSNLPVFRRLVRMIECIPVNRDGEDIGATRKALRHLRNGKALGVFPQGRIAAPGEEVDAKLGVAMLALQSKSPVIPAHISGTHYSDDVAPPFFRRHRARVRFGEPVDLSAYYNHRKDRQVVEQVQALIMDRIWRLAPDGQPPVSSG